MNTWFTELNDELANALIRRMFPGINKSKQTRVTGYYWVRMFGTWIIAWWQNDEQQGRGWMVIDRHLKVPLSDADLDEIDPNPVTRWDSKMMTEIEQLTLKTKRLNIITKWFLAAFALMIIARNFL